MSSRLILEARICDKSTSLGVWGKGEGMLKKSSNSNYSEPVQLLLV